MNINNLSNNLFYGSIDKILVYCFEFLEELGIQENEYKSIIMQAIENNIKEKPIKREKRGDVDYLLVNYISNYFTQEFTPRYFFSSDYVKKFHLVYLDETCIWKISNIGNYFLRLNMMDALSLISVLSMISNNLGIPVKDKLSSLNEWLDNGEIPESRNILGHDIINGFGLFEMSILHKRKLNLYGKVVVKNIVKYFDKYFDIIQTLLEAEFIGDFVYYSPEIFTEAIDKFKSSVLIDDAFLRRLELSINHYKFGDYTAAYNLLIPQIEELINIALKKANIDYSKSKGLADKFKLLDDKGILNDNTSLKMLVRSVRNFVAHGEEIRDIQLFVPLYQVIIAYMVREINTLTNYFANRV